MKLQKLQMIQIFVECKIMVGCRRCIYPSIHVFVSRSRSVVDCALSFVWCLCALCGMCGVRVVCVLTWLCACDVCCGVYVVLWCCVLCWWCVVVVCGVVVFCVVWRGLECVEHERVFRVHTEAS